MLVLIKDALRKAMEQLSLFSHLGIDPDTGAGPKTVKRKAHPMRTKSGKVVQVKESKTFQSKGRKAKQVINNIKQKLTNEEEYLKLGTRAKSFKQWFGDWENDPEKASKVVNVKGEPQEEYNITPVPLFHGTAYGGFTAFDKKKMKPGLYGNGFYFTEDKEIAEEYTKKDSNNDALEILLSKKYYNKKDNREIKNLTRKEAESLIHSIRKSKRHYASNITEHNVEHDHIEGSLKLSYNKEKQLYDFRKFIDLLGNGDNGYLLNENGERIENKWENLNGNNWLKISESSSKFGLLKLKDMLNDIGIEFDIEKVPSQVFEVYLNIKNPLDLDGDMRQADELLDQMEEKGKREAIDFAKRTIKKFRENVEYYLKNPDEYSLDDKQKWFYKMIPSDDPDAYRGQVPHHPTFREMMNKSDKELMDYLKKNHFMFRDNDITHFKHLVDEIPEDVLVPWALKKGYITEKDKYTNDTGPIAERGKEEHYFIGDGTIPGTRENIYEIADMIAKHGLMTYDRKSDTQGRKYIPTTPEGKPTLQHLSFILSDGGWSYHGGEILNEWAKEKGHDGLSHTGGWNFTGGENPSHKVWIAFEPNQIKATNNNGDFSMDNVDIYKAILKAMQQLSLFDQLGVVEEHHGPKTFTRDPYYRDGKLVIEQKQRQSKGSVTKKKMKRPKSPEEEEKIRNFLKEVDELKKKTKKDDESKQKGKKDDESKGKKKIQETSKKRTPATSETDGGKQSRGTESSGGDSAGGHEIIEKNYERKGGDQPYEGYGIQTSRSEYTVFPEGALLSKDIARTLRPHQEDGVNLALEKFKTNKGFMLADSTGSGKTRSQLAMAAQRAKEGESVLIVTQSKEIITGSFTDDAKAMGIEFLHSPGPPENMEKGKIYITTYNRLPEWDISKLDGDTTTAKHKPGLLILDEAHNLKNIDTAQSISGVQLIKNSKNVCMATATPLDKGEHIHYIAATYGMKFHSVLNQINYTATEGMNGTWYKPRYSHENSAEAISSFFDKLTEDGLMVKREVSMSNLDYHREEVPLDPVFRNKLEVEHEIMMEEMDAAKSPRTRAMIKAAGLQRMRRLLEESKIEHTYNKIKEEIKAGRQVVLFAERVNDASMKGQLDSQGTMKVLKKRLEEDGILHSDVYGNKKKGRLNKKTGVRVGSTQEQIDKFNDGTHKVILTTPGSGGTGINLDDRTGKAPRTAIIMTPPFSANNVVQMLGRINRLTTKSPAKAMMMYTDHAVDDWNMSIIEAKLSKLGATVKGDYSNINLAHTDYMTDGEAQDMVLNKLNKNRKEPLKVPATPMAPSYTKKTNIPKTWRNMDVVNISYDDHLKAKEIAWKIARSKGQKNIKGILSFQGAFKKWTVNPDFKDEFDSVLDKRKWVHVSLDKFEGKDEMRRILGKDMEWHGRLGGQFAAKKWSIPEERLPEVQHLLKMQKSFQKAVKIVQVKDYKANRKGRLVLVSHHSQAYKTGTGVVSKEIKPKQNKPKMGLFINLNRRRAKTIQERRHKPKDELIIHALDYTSGGYKLFEVREGDQKIEATEKVVENIKHVGSLKIFLKQSNEIVAEYVDMANKMAGKFHAIMNSQFGYKLNKGDFSSAAYYGLVQASMTIFPDWDSERKKATIITRINGSLKDELVSDMDLVAVPLDKRKMIFRIQQSMMNWDLLPDDLKEKVNIEVRARLKDVPAFEKYPEDMRKKKISQIRGEIVDRVAGERLVELGPLPEISSMHDHETGELYDIPDKEYNKDYELNHPLSAVRAVVIQEDFDRISQKLKKILNPYELISFKMKAFGYTDTEIGETLQKYYENKGKLPIIMAEIKPKGDTKGPSAYLKQGYIPENYLFKELKGNAERKIKGSNAKADDLSGLNYNEKKIYTLKKQKMSYRDIAKQIKYKVKSTGEMKTMSEAGVRKKYGEILLKVGSQKGPEVMAAEMMMSGWRPHAIARKFYIDAQRKIESNYDYLKNNFKKSIRIVLNGIK